MSSSGMDERPEVVVGRARIEAALADLDAAERADLGNASREELVSLVERLRTSLADMIRLTRIKGFGP